MPEHVGPPHSTTQGGDSRISLGTAMAIAALAAVAAVVGTIVFRPMAGDEPSIRVRGGSIYLDLNSPSARWEWDSKHLEWKIMIGNKETKREKEDYYFDIAATAGCTGSNNGKGKVVTFTHLDGDVKVSVVAQIKGKKTKVTGDGLKKLTEQTLILDMPDRHVSEITIDGTGKCSFASTTDFTTGLFDYD